jgi:DNA-binding MarR family transcriptional regulator
LAARNRRILRPARIAARAGSESEASSWTFLSNHAHVLITLAEDPTLPLRDVAQRVGITERSVQRIVSELEEGGYLVRTREGRCNRYTLRRAQPLRHPIEMHKRVGDLIAMVLET